MLQRLLDKVTSYWDRLEGYRTVIFGVLLSASGVVLELLTFLQTIDLSSMFGVRTTVVLNIVIGVTIIILRYCTTTPIGTQPEKPEGE